MIIFFYYLRGEDKNGDEPTRGTDSNPEPQVALPRSTTTQGGIFRMLAIIRMFQVNRLEHESHPALGQMILFDLTPF